MELLCNQLAKLLDNTAGPLSNDNIFTQVQNMTMVIPKSNTSTTDSETVYNPFQRGVYRPVSVKL